MQPIPFTYPMDSLAIIAPIIFIVLIISFPLIGFFAGWKRAAFWGGGSLLFYFIGMLIWVYAGSQVVKPIEGLIVQLLQSIEGAESITIDGKLIVSVAAPIWFMFWMGISELFLLINYYAWYKRVVGLKKIKVKDSKTGKITKQYAKVNKKAGTVGYKVGNRLGGVLLLGALTVPSTIAFTQTVYYLTSTTATRSSSSLSTNLYNGLQGLSDGPFNWATYYPSTGEDYDSIFSAMSLINKEITYKDPETGAETTTDMMTYVEDVIGKGVTDLITTVGSVGQETEEGHEVTSKDVADDLSAVAGYWNDLVNQCEDEVTAIFNSENVTEAVNQIIGPIIESTINPEQEGGLLPVSEETYETLFGEDSLFQSYVDDYINKKEIGGNPVEPFVQIEVPQQTIDTMTDLFLDFIDTTLLEEAGIEGYEQTITNSIKNILNLLFLPKETK